jgi:hypothetical protein
MIQILRTGDPARKKLDGIESAIAEAKAEIDATDRAPLTHRETAARIKRAIDSNIAQYATAYRFSALQSSDEQTAQAAKVVSQSLSLCEIAYLIGTDAVVSSIMKRIEDNGGEVGLPFAERAKRIATLQGKLRTLERDCEREALRLEAQGHVIIRREDCDVTEVIAVWAENEPHSEAEAA